MSRTRIAAPISAALAAVLSFSAFCATAHAQAWTLPPPAAAPATPAHKPTTKELASARKHFEAAEAAKAKGDDQTAAQEYLAAYALFPEPEFYFDVAEVVRRSGDDAGALAYYEAYLALDPSGRGADGARTAAAAIHTKLDAAAAAQRAAAEDAARKQAEIDRTAEAQRAADARAQADAAHHDTAPTAAPAHHGRGLRLAGLGTAGVGVIAIGVGVGFGVHARSISNEAASWDTFDPARYEQGKAAQRNMYVFTGVGAAALVAGGVLYFLGRDHTEADAGAVTLVPTISPGDLGVAATGRF